MNDLLIINAKIWTLDEQGTLEKGWLAAKDGVITAVSSGDPPADIAARTEIDAEGKNLLPGLVDCHTHLMEYATAGVHNAQSLAAQKSAAIANLLTALKCGIVATGEHQLGHNVLAMPMDDYKAVIKSTPMASTVAYGNCWLGFEPKIFTACTRPGDAFGEDCLSDGEYRQMAAASDFAGENIFLSYTSATAPIESAPYIGEVTYSRDKLQRIIDIFHSENKKVGAHIDGEESARLFIECGGDVIHHGLGLTPELGAAMAEKGISLVITPAVGSKLPPISPKEAYALYRQGIFMALASDSYIPLHPKAEGIPLPSGYAAGPEEFLKVTAPTLRYFVEQGASKEEALKLITVNGRMHIRPDEPPATLTIGRPADIILCNALPALETDNPDDIITVITAGQVQIDKRCSQ